jgi:hypothetical protein
MKPFKKDTELYPLGRQDDIIVGFWEKSDADFPARFDGRQGHGPSHPEVSPEHRVIGVNLPISDG